MTKQYIQAALVDQWGGKIACYKIGKIVYVVLHYTVGLNPLPINYIIATGLPEIELGGVFPDDAGTSVASAFTLNSNGVFSGNKNVGIRNRNGQGVIFSMNGLNFRDELICSFVYIAKD